MRMQEYTGLTTLYLQSNAISKIEGLDRLLNLRTLCLGKASMVARARDGGGGQGMPAACPHAHYACRGIVMHACMQASTGCRPSQVAMCVLLVSLAQNMLEDTCGLEHLTQLDSLDLSDNHITTLTCLSPLTALRTLNVSGNKLGPSAASISHLLECPGIRTLDLAGNRLEAPEAVETVLAMQWLSYVRLTGNPVVSSFRQAFAGSTWGMGRAA